MAKGRKAARKEWRNDPEGGRPMYAAPGEMREAKEGQVGLMKEWLDAKYYASVSDTAAERKKWKDEMVELRDEFKHDFPHADFDTYADHVKRMEGWKAPEKLIPLSQTERLANLANDFGKDTIRVVRALHKGGFSLESLEAGATGAVMLAFGPVESQVILKGIHMAKNTNEYKAAKAMLKAKVENEEFKEAFTLVRDIMQELKDIGTDALQKGIQTLGEKIKETGKRHGVEALVWGSIFAGCVAALGLIPQGKGTFLRVLAGVGLGVSTVGMTGQVLAPMFKDDHKSSLNVLYNPESLIGPGFAKVGAALATYGITDAWALEGVKAFASAPANVLISAYKKTRGQSHDKMTVNSKELQPYLSWNADEHTMALGIEWILASIAKNTGLSESTDNRVLAEEGIQILKEMNYDKLEVAYLLPLVVGGKVKTGAKSVRSAAPESTENITVNIDPVIDIFRKNEIQADIGKGPNGTVLVNGFPFTVSKIAELDGHYVFMSPNRKTKIRVPAEVNEDVKPRKQKAETVRYVESLQKVKEWSEKRYEATKVDKLGGASYTSEYDREKHLWILRDSSKKPFDVDGVEAITGKKSELELVLAFNSQGRLEIRDEESGTVHESLQDAKEDTLKSAAIAKLKEQMGYLLGKLSYTVDPEDIDTSSTPVSVKIKYNGKEGIVDFDKGKVDAISLANDSAITTAIDAEAQALSDDIFKNNVQAEAHALKLEGELRSKYGFIDTATVNTAGKVVLKHQVDVTLKILEDVHAKLTTAARLTPDTWRKERELIRTARINDFLNIKAGDLVTKQLEDEKYVPGEKFANQAELMARQNEAAKSIRDLYWPADKIESNLFGKDPFDALLDKVIEANTKLMNDEIAAEGALPTKKAVEDIIKKYEAIAGAEGAQYLGLAKSAKGYFFNDKAAVTGGMEIMIESLAGDPNWDASSNELLSYLTNHYTYQNSYTIDSLKMLGLSEQQATVYLEQEGTVLAGIMMDWANKVNNAAPTHPALASRYREFYISKLSPLLPDPRESILEDTRNVGADRVGKVMSAIRAIDGYDKWLFTHGGPAGYVEEDDAAKLAKETLRLDKKTARANFEKWAADNIELGTWTGFEGALPDLFMEHARQRFEDVYGRSSNTPDLRQDMQDLGDFLIAEKQFYEYMIYHNVSPYEHEYTVGSPLTIAHLIYKRIGINVPTIGPGLAGGKHLIDRLHEITNAAFDIHFIKGPRGGRSVAAYQATLKSMMLDEIKKAEERDSKTYTFGPLEFEAMHGIDPFNVSP